MDHHMHWNNKSCNPYHKDVKNKNKNKQANKQTKKENKQRSKQKKEKF